MDQNKNGVNDEKLGGEYPKRAAGRRQMGVNVSMKTVYAGPEMLREATKVQAPDPRMVTQGNIPVGENNGEMKVCANCGTKCQAGAKFCFECGISFPK